MNLSETTFVLPPDEPGADYKVRIFTTSTELPFAGHPTLGTCHAWLTSGGTPKQDGEIVQQCPAGLIQVRQTEAGLAFAAPPLVRSGPAEEPLVKDIADALGIDRAAIRAALHDRDSDGGRRSAGGQSLAFGGYRRRKFSP